MIGPKIICNACGSACNNVVGFCDECLEMFLEHEFSICTLCDAGFKRDNHGLHLSAAGGYAGKCTAPGGNPREL